MSYLNSSQWLPMFTVYEDIPVRGYADETHSCTLLSPWNHVIHWPTESCVLDISHSMSANRLKLNTDRQNCCSPAQVWVADWQVSRTPAWSWHYCIVACSHGVYISSDLSLDHHISHICAGCYCRIHQLWRLWWSCDSPTHWLNSLHRCKFKDWLLQHCSCWHTKDSNRQVTACVERCCARRHQHL